jgi:hypothetical protein
MLRVCLRSIYKQGVQGCKVELEQSHVRSERLLGCMQTGAWYRNLRLRTHVHFSMHCSSKWHNYCAKDTALALTALQVKSQSWFAVPRFQFRCTQVGAEKLGVRLSPDPLSQLLVAVRIRSCVENKDVVLYRYLACLASSQEEPMSSVTPSTCSAQRFVIFITASVYVSRYNTV